MKLVLILVSGFILASCASKNKVEADRAPSQVTGEVGVAESSASSSLIIGSSVTIQLKPGVDFNYRVSRLGAKHLCAFELYFKGTEKSVKASSDENINGLNKQEVEQACENFASNSKLTTRAKAHLRGPAIGDAEAFFQGESSEVEAKISLINVLFAN